MTQLRRDIEGLRAIAILLVVAYHAGLPGLPGGYVGVDVFFVLSGYLITGLLARELERTGSICLSEFYARRLRRLMPALAVMVLVSIGCAALLYAPVEQDGLANTGIATVSYLSNVYFTRAATDYLRAPADANPFLHTWSLSVEEQFYIVWPLFVLAGAGVLLGSRQFSQRSLTAWVVGLGTVSFGISLWLMHGRQPWAFFLSPPRAWEFAAGGLAVLQARRVRPYNVQNGGPPSEVLGWIGFAGLAVAATMFSRTTPFPGWAAGLPVAATVLLLHSTDRVPDGRVSALLGTAALQPIGRLSYSWYLWHWPVIVFARAIKQPLGGIDRASAVLLSLLLAYASYRLVEHPVRHSRTLSLRPRRTFMMAAAVSCALLVVAGSWKFAASRWSQGPTQARYSPIRYDLPVIYAMGCDDYFHSASVKECHFGNEHAERTAVLFGDSHAGQWFPAVHKIFEDRGWRLIVLTKSACPPVDASYFFQDIGRTYTECQEWVRGSLGALALMHPDLVLVSHATEYPFTDEQWKGGLQRVVDSLSRSSGSVLLLRDTPKLAFDVPNCLARLDWRLAILPRTAGCIMELHQGPDPVYQLQLANAAEHPNVATIDMTNEVCPAGWCEAYRNGVISYRDTHHLSTAFAQTLAKSLSQQIDAHLTGEGIAATLNGPRGGIHGPDLSLKR